MPDILASTVATSAAARQRARKKRPVLRLLKIGFQVFFLCLVILSVLLGIRWKQELDAAAAKIPKLPDIMAQLVRQPTVILSDDGQELFRLSAEYRRPVRIADVPRIVKQATLAAEDKRFYQHNGVDYWAMLRVLFTNVREGRIAQGGSTLTMQLAKRVYTSSAKTLDRKLEDMALAVMMERELTKDQILELYLNQVFYGSGAFGISAAADVYFGKSLKQLTVSDAALLARCVRRPSQENPFANLQRAIENRNIVLDTMRREGMITEGQYEQALREAPKLRKGARNSVQARKLAPYFVDYVLEELRRLMPGVDVSAGGYRVETTLNYKLQKVAEEQARLLVRNRRNVTTAAFVLLDKDGRMLAMVGGVDYARNQFNVISQGKRQPGSAFKPFMYATGLDEGVIEPFDRISNSRFVTTTLLPNGKPWIPKNSSGRYGGMVSIRTAISQSLNVPAVRAMEKVGPERVVAACQSVFGFKSKLDAVPSLVLGASAVSPLEMAEGYSVFMLRGNRLNPFGLSRVVGPDGTTVLEVQPKISQGVLSSTVAETMDSFLRAVVTSGTARAASGIANARGKTGTTSENRDAWFIGYTDELLGVGWIANEVRDKGMGTWIYREMPGVFGGTVTVQMWRGVLLAAQKLIGEKPRDMRELDQYAYSRRSERRDIGSVQTSDQGQPSNDGEQPMTPPEAPQVQPEEDAPQPESTPPSEQPDQQPTDQGRGTASITLRVCADTGLIATIYCPERVLRAFKRGNEPKRRCALHIPG